MIRVMWTLDELKDAELQGVYDLDHAPMEDLRNTLHPNAPEAISTCLQIMSDHGQMTPLYQTSDYIYYDSSGEKNYECSRECSVTVLEDQKVISINIWGVDDKLQDKICELFDLDNWGDIHIGFTNSKDREGLKRDMGQELYNLTYGIRCNPDPSSERIAQLNKMYKDLPEGKIGCTRPQ